MKRFLKSSIVFALAVIFSSLTWTSSASFRGRTTAQYDVRHGHYRLLIYGLADWSSSEEGKLLRDRYGIEVKAVAGCIVSDSLLKYVHSYNEVSREAVLKKFGHDVFYECSRDADRASAAPYSPSLR